MSTRRSILAATVLLAAGTALRARALAQAPAGFRLIVNPQNPAAAVERKFVADAFLKKVTRWADGPDAIRAVDLRSDSPVRQGFSEIILRRSVAAVKSYWQQQVFSGRDVPPPELDSDEDVVKYVRRVPEALGYVSESANLHGVKVLVLR